MADKPQITRYEIITPTGCKLNDYGDLIVSPGDIKVNKKHASLHPIFQNSIGQPIKVGYAVYMEKEYVQTAELGGAVSPAVKKTPSSEIAPAGKGTAETPEKQASIEIQNAYTGVILLIVCGAIKKDDPLGQTALNYAMSKLGRWSSVGSSIEEAPGVDGTSVKDAIPEELATLAQIKKIVATAKKQGYDTQTAVAIMNRLWHKASSKSLTKREADEFIAVMEQGKYLTATEVEPQDLPF